MNRTRTFDLTYPTEDRLTADIRDDHVSNYAPSMVTQHASVVNMMDGKTFRIEVPFHEFHTWMIAPSKDKPEGDPPEHLVVAKRGVKRK